MNILRDHVCIEVSKGVRKSTGENLLGQVVTALVEDFICSVEYCTQKSTKIIQPNYKEETI